MRSLSSAAISLSISTAAASRTMPRALQRMYRAMPMPNSGSSCSQPKLANTSASRMLALSSRSER
ncbi:hypothetical protein D3C84_1268800 [compost metagenome]